MKNLNNTLKHIAIIMDGNGRWANKQKKMRKEGHKVGANNVLTITKACIELKIPYLTLYAFSTENWSRPKIEVDFLMKLLEQYLDSQRQVYLDNQIRFNVIGDITEFSQKLQTKLFRLQEETQDFTTLIQTLAINYGSHDEIARSVLKIVRDNTAIPSNKHDMKEAIQNNLDTSFLPLVDILIRTGGEKRISNFLLWQSSYAELFFTDTLWPDFSMQELQHIITEFSMRIRKFGNI